MAIPKHDEIRPVALEFLQDGKPRQLRDFEAPLAEKFGLNEEEVARYYDSGNARIFYDRISWALSYLRIAGVVDKPQRGVYRINEKGRELVGRPEELQKYVHEKHLERDRLKRQEQSSQAAADSLPMEDSELTPQEQLYQSFEDIRRSVYDEILDVILSKAPRQFEHLVVELLQKMGYGGQVDEPGEVTNFTNDGGIDGVIKEDVLGLGRVHIQAKRYARDNTVGRDEIQKFVGALAVAQSKKGVFITTSKYSQGAVEYAESLHGSTTLVLVDGLQLARFIYDYGIGMQVEQTIEIKKLDSDYWDKMQDDE